MRFQLETNYYPKERYKSNLIQNKSNLLVNRVKLENKKTLIIKDGKYYQPNASNDLAKKQLNGHKRNVLNCLNLLSPRSQQINLLTLRQSRNRSKRATTSLRRTQSEYINKSNQIASRRLSIETDSVSGSKQLEKHELTKNCLKDSKDSNNSTGSEKGISID